jgi:hypothetical protein
MRLSRKIPSNREIMNDILREMCALRRQVGYELRYINIDKDNADRNKIHNLTKVAVLLYALRYQYEFKHGESAFKTLSDELVYGECTLEYIGEVLGAFYDELCSVIFPAELMDGFKCENSSTGTPAEGLPENIETFAGYLIDCCDFDKSLDTVFDHLYGDADKPQNKT